MELIAQDLFNYFSIIIINSVLEMLKGKSNILKKKVELRNIRKNDLIFWKGHVAIVISKSKLIHAYAPFKKVVVMPIKKTINRIYTTANLKIIGIRRIGWYDKEWRQDGFSIV